MSDKLAFLISQPTAVSHGRLKHPSRSSPQQTLLMRAVLGDDKAQRQSDEGATSVDQRQRHVQLFPVAVEEGQLGTGECKFCRMVSDRPHETLGFHTLLPQSPMRLASSGL